MDPDTNPLEGYSPVHAGVMTETGHAPAPSASSTLGESVTDRKLDEILFAVRAMERNLEEMKRELDAIRMQSIHHP